MKTIKYNPTRGEYITEDGEVFRRISIREQELLDISSKWRRLFEDSLGEFVIIDGRHYRVISG